MWLVSKLERFRRQRLLAADTLRFGAEKHRRAVLSYPPRSVTITVASACMNRCVFCAYHARDARGESKVYGLPFTLSLEDFRRIVDLCYKARVPKVHICATGKPFLHHDILAMIDHVAAVYGKASVQTNFASSVFRKRGILDALLDRKDRISYITTDILSGDPETHELLKQGSSYEDVLDAMQHLSAHSSIHFEVHYIIAKYNYLHLDRLINDLADRQINCHLALANLHAYGFNEYTDPAAVYTRVDTQITRALEAAQELGRRRDIRVTVPAPSDGVEQLCGAFWSRLQTWPVAGIDTTRYGDNAIVGACAAVVTGDLKSLGYVFDYDDLMQLWNNEQLVAIRRNLLRGVYPDGACRQCQSYAPHLFRRQAKETTTPTKPGDATLLRRLVRRFAPPDERVPWEVDLAPTTVDRVLHTCGLGDDQQPAEPRVLDFGCGNGRYLEAFATRLDRQHIVGVEAAWKRLREVADKGFPCTWVGSTQSALPFADYCFDVVFSSNVVEHIPRAQYLECLREIHRVLRPGGRFVVGTPNYPVKRLYDLAKALSTGPLEYYLFDDPTHCNRLSFSQLDQDLRRVFGEVHLWPTYLAWQRRFRLLRRPEVRQRLRVFGDKILGYCVKATDDNRP